MSLFPVIVPKKEKKVVHHPWEKTIRDEYTKYIKYAHNSINNPFIPKKPEKKPYGFRFKFTIIGNRLSEDFIYCVRVLEGLHRYRPKVFEAPVVRGVFKIEWPLVWNDLKRQYGSEVYCLLSPVAVLCNGEFFGGYPELKEFVDSNYYYDIKVNAQKDSEKNFANFVKGSNKSCAYLHISVNEKHIGPMVFMLYTDIVPRTCENFLRLCKLTKGGYPGTPIHRIVKDCWIQCGGFTLKEVDLGCENFAVPPDRRGALGMANDGRDVNCSTQFFVLLRPADWMAHKYVIFGQLIEGYRTLKKIEKEPTWNQSPTNHIQIDRAGILNLDCKDIKINPHTHSYLEKHVENLTEIGEMFIELLMERVYLEVGIRRIARLEALGEGIEEESTISSSESSIRKKSGENNDFDVDVYEPEEFVYPTVTAPTQSVEDSKPIKPFYLPFTDVPYPGETDSTYDLKKFLRGDYCLETDLMPSAIHHEHHAKIGRRMSTESEDSNFVDVPLKIDDEDAEDDVKRYIQENSDRISFAGDVVRSIAKGVKGTLNLFDNRRKSEMITDEELRKFRLASICAESAEKKVSISVDKYADVKQRIKRRQTGFLTPEDVKRLSVAQEGKEEEEQADEQDEQKKAKEEESEDEYEKSPGLMEQIKRRQTTFGAELEKVKMYEKDEPDSSDSKDSLDKNPEKSVLFRPSTVDPANKIKRRMTGFVRKEDLEKIKIFDKDEESSESLQSPEKSVLFRPSTCDTSNAAKIKRRITGFVRKEDLQKIQIYELEEEEDDDEEYDQEDKSAVMFRPSTLDTSNVAKIKRRQTGFVKREDFEKILIDIDDDDDDDEEDEEDDDVADIKTDDSEKSVMFRQSTFDTSNAEKIKRRQTGFVKREDLAKIKIIQRTDSEEIEELAMKKEAADDSERRKTEIDKRKVSINAIKEPTKVTQRRQTGFVKADDYAGIQSAISLHEQEIERRRSRAMSMQVKRRLSTTSFDDEEDFNFDPNNIPDDNIVAIEQLEEDFRPVDEPPPPVIIKEDDPVPMQIPHSVKTKTAKKLQGFADDVDVQEIEKRNSSDKPTATNVRKVSVVIAAEDVPEHKIKRRQTGFVKADDYQAIQSAISIHEQELERRRSRAASMVQQRRLSTTSIDDDYNLEIDAEPRQSVLDRLYEDFRRDDNNPPPTLKNLQTRASQEAFQDIPLLRASEPIKSEETVGKKYYRASVEIEQPYDSNKVLDIQHGAAITRNISSDYVQTIEKPKVPNSSITSMEFSKRRPSMSVAQYQERYSKESLNNSKIGLDESRRHSK